MADTHGDPQTTCQGCRHWHEQGRDPTNLGAPPVGQCRGAPPQLVVVPEGAGLVIRPLLPLLPANFPACGLYRSRLALPTVSAN